MRLRIKDYIKKLQTRYNKGAQVNCKVKGGKIVFTPKYRRKVIHNPYQSSLDGILWAYKDIEIIEGHFIPNHVCY